MHETLFTPVRLGAIEAPNRIVMAPLTRARSDESGVPNAMMAQYYAQRASAGLIISEATGISREGLGWPHAPGIWTNEQVEGWKRVTGAVHEAGGRIVCQLWHMGRLVSSSMLDGAPPVSASATQAPGQAHTFRGKLDFDVARPLETSEMARVVADYAHAARNAIAAGFDGVQLHGANGYLIDQFLRDGSNLRDDDYGGSPENRCRLMREVLEGLIAECGAPRVSIRLSPNDAFQGCADSDNATLFSVAASVLQDLQVGFLELREPGENGSFGKGEGPKKSPMMQAIYKGPVVHNSDYNAASAEADIRAGLCDAVSFGRPFIANPDLPERIRTGAPWADAVNVPQSWYSAGAEGYTDYPALALA